MTEKITIERSIWINASREAVWQALTDPQKIEAWFSPGTPWKLTALQVGGRLYVENPESQEEMYTQVIELFDPPQRLVMCSQDEPIFHTSYTLEVENNGTRLDMVHSGYENLSDNDRRQSMADNSRGFEFMLGNIKAVIEGLPLPNAGGF